MRTRLDRSTVADRQATASPISAIEPFFEHVHLSPPGWPVAVAAAAAGERAFRRWPKFPPAATVDRGRLGHGRGADRRACRLRAVGEIIEIASCCAWGDEEIVRASLSDLGPDAWGPAEVTGFSGAQLRHRAAWNGRLSGVDWIAPATSAKANIDWMQARSLISGEPVWVPADAVLIGRQEPGDPDAVAVADTNGCACGETPDAALLAALYELIERDATGRWWYGGRARAAIPVASLALGVEIEGHLDRRGRALRLIDITSDIGIPTVAAVSADRAGRHVAAGFATRAGLDAAAEAALMELMQMELKVAAALGIPLLARGLETWFDEIDLNDAAPLVMGAEVDASALSRSVGSDLSTCLQRLERCNCRVATIDFSRPAFGLPVYRAISPDLCHWKPRFGRRRLLQSDRRDLYRHPACVRRPNPRLLRI